MHAAHEPSASHMSIILKENQAGHVLPSQDAKSIRHVQKNLSPGRLDTRLHVDWDLCQRIDRCSSKYMCQPLNLDQDAISGGFRWRKLSRQANARMISVYMLPCACPQGCVWPAHQGIESSSLAGAQGRPFSKAHAFEGNMAPSQAPEHCHT